MAIDTQVKVSGTWRRVKAIWTRQGGVWKKVNATFSNVGGAQKKTFRRRYRYIRFFITFNGSTTGIKTMSYRAFGAEYPIPAMTSNTAPSPLVASASNELGAAYLAFDDSVGFWTPAGAGASTGEWLTIDLGSGNGIGPDQVTIEDIVGGFTLFNIEVSDDNSSWKILVQGTYTGAGPHVFAIP